MLKRYKRFKRFKLSKLSKISERSKIKKYIYIEQTQALETYIHTVNLVPNKRSFIRHLISQALPGGYSPPTVQSPFPVQSVCPVILCNARNFLSNYSGGLRGGGVEVQNMPGEIDPYVHMWTEEGVTFMLLLKFLLSTFISFV